MSAIEPIASRARTKIVATVGPACNSSEMLQELVGAGVDVFRLNMAHGQLDDHARTMEYIKAASLAGERPLGVLVDLAGPKIRLGEITPDPMECRRGDTLRIVRDAHAAASDLTCTYDRLIDELNLGDRVMLADGTVELVVTTRTNDAVECRVVSPGIIRSRQGINLPGVHLTVSAMSDLDREHARWAVRHGADFVSLSFVRCANDVRLLKDLLRAEGSAALAIAKIEKPEALEHLDAIVQASDGIMVARGDLGVEIDVAEMPMRQKEIIQTCHRYKKPVIVATQMLDSMQRSSRPTRAEVTDVANAILDGADACMLSGETAIGQFPLESVQMMNRVMVSTENQLRDHARPFWTSDQATSPVHPITSAIVAGAGQIASCLDAKIVVIFTHSGRTALTKAKQRDFIPTVAVSDRPETLRQMCLYWGINPLAGTHANLQRDLIPFIERWGKQQRLLQIGDRIVLITGGSLGSESHNQLVVHEVT